jgi:phosphotransferase system enzyme I (PtsI)
MILPPPFVPESSVYRGIGVGVGLAVGPVHIISAHDIRHPRYKLVSQEMVDEELGRLRSARERTAAKIAAARDALPEELKSHGGILEAHLLLLNDPFLMGSAEKRIAEDKMNAEYAVTQSVKRIIAVMGGIEDAYIKSRLHDVELVGQALVAAMQEKADAAGPVFQPGCIVAAVDLSPTEVASLPMSRVAGLITERGSQTSHTAIVAQAISLPTVVGAAGLLKNLEHGDALIVDAREGHVIHNPDEDAVKFYQARRQAGEAFQAEIVRSAHLPAVTLDDHRVQVFGNLELVEELPAIMSYGGEGIGLYRTEFLYLARRELPTEEELFEVYRRVVASAFPRPVVIRTLDVGADKVPAVSGLEGALQNQALGLRAIRFCLKHPDIFRVQLRAVLRASAHGQARIMLPMISNLEEVRAARRHLEECRLELSREGKPTADRVPVGLMVEVPAAVILVRELAQEADFLSIGTNDLIQYGLALDRTNPDVADLYQPLHPSVLRMIKSVVDAGREAGLSVSVCGDMASVPQSAPVLVGLGADTLSMPSSSIPIIKRLLRMSSYEDMKEMAHEILRSGTAEAAAAVIDRALGHRFAELLH